MFYTNEELFLHPYILSYNPREFGKTTVSMVIYIFFVKKPQTMVTYIPAL